MQVFKQYPTDRGRQALAQICRERGLTKTAVEVGVWRGDFSRPFFDEWDGEKLYLVDPWRKLDNYDDIRNENFDPDDFRYVVERFVGFDERVEIVRATSREAVENALVPSCLDFVYLDGDHSYSETLYDIINWWDKLRGGGILAGHDLFAPELCGVTNAVDEFARATNKTVNVIADNYDSWFIVKDDE